MCSSRTVTAGDGATRFVCHPACRSPTTAASACVASGWRSYRRSVRPCGSGGFRRRVGRWSVTARLRLPAHPARPDLLWQRRRRVLARRANAGRRLRPRQARSAASDARHRPVRPHRRAAADRRQPALPPDRRTARADLAPWYTGAMAAKNDDTTRHALHALFQRRVDGDDAPLRLARLRFEQFGLAAEIHGGSAAELEHTLAFVPRGGRPADAAPAPPYRPCGAQ